MKIKNLWKKGNHNGNDRLGFKAKPHDYGTFSRWAYINYEYLSVGAFNIGNTPIQKKIEAWTSGDFISGFVRLVKKRKNNAPEPFVNIGSQTWSTQNYNHLSTANINISEIENPKQWGEQTRLEKPAYCYYKNNPENGVVLYNYYACNAIEKSLPEGTSIASLSDFKELFDYCKKDTTGLLSLLDIYYWQNFYVLKQKNITANGFNLKPEGSRKATFVTIFEGESIFNYKFFSGKGKSAFFWTLDGYVVKVFFQLGKLKYETYDGDSYYNGLGLSIRLIKHE